MKTKGFTLTEIIVVLVVVIVLSAIITPRLGTVTRSARNTAITRFLQECPAIRAKMYYGDPAQPGYDVHHPGAATNSMPLASLLIAAGFENAQATLDPAGNLLTITGIPATFFRTHETTLVINFTNQTYNGASLTNFLQQVQWP